MTRPPDSGAPGPDELLGFGLLLGVLPLAFSPIYLLWEPYDAITGSVATAGSGGSLGAVVDAVLYSYQVAFVPTYVDRPATFVESFPVLVESATVLGLLVLLVFAAFRTRRSTVK